MCLDLLRNPVKAIEDAKKQKNMTKIFSITVLTAIIFAISIGIFMFRTAFSTTPLIIGGSMIVFFLFSLVCILFLGLIVEISVNTLGGKGTYYEGLTSSTYSLFIISVGLLIASIFMLVPYGIVVSVIVFGVLLSLGLSILYRSVKELFKTDMITSFVTISIVTMTFFIALFLISVLTVGDLSKFMPMMV
ncbi:MAG: YIP1 family protein [Candidatus Aenigmatarchaeota archaeon]